MKNLITIWLLCIAFAASAQQAAISGFVRYEVYFPTKHPKPKANPTEFYFSSSESLSISSVVNKDVPPTNPQQPSRAEQKQQTDSREGVGIKLPYGDELGERIYRNIRKKTLITRRPFNAISEAFIVREQWVEIDWKINNDKTKKIGSYTVTHAKGSFRGRDYTVWFSYDIPVPFGPWKLHGLPGLILEAEDSEKMMRMYATEIQTPFELDSIIQVPSADKEISHKEEVYMRDNFDELLVQKFNSRLPKDTGSRFSSRPNTDGRKYHPERSFEWEEEAAPGKKRKAKK